MSYSMRLTWPDNPGRPNDFVFQHSGIDVGRCYRRIMARTEVKWQWTIYIGTNISRAVEGIAIIGHEDTLDEAKAAFRKSFDAMIAAGVFKTRDQFTAFTTGGGVPPGK